MKHLPEWPPNTPFPASVDDEPRWAAAWSFADFHATRTRDARRGHRDKRLPEWPVDEPLPRFRRRGEARRFWRAFSFAELLDTTGGLVKPRGKIRRRRPHP